MDDGDSAAKALELYGSLREIAFATTPDMASLPPGRSSEDIVYGAIMEFRQDDFDWTVFCALENAGRYVHLALYCSSGFMVIGERFPDSAFLAGRRFIDLAAEFLPEMSASNDHMRPPDGKVRLYALAVGGLATEETPMEALEHSMEFSPLVQAGIVVIDEMMKVVPPQPN
jgi:hypothetical protein